MKILILDTYYEGFLKNVYKKNVSLKNKSYEEQKNYLLSKFFGTSDSYSKYLNDLNFKAEDLIVNCFHLQSKWAKENKMRIFKFAIHPRIYKLPYLGNLLGNLSTLGNITEKQIIKLKPDIIYCQNISFFPPELLKRIKNNTKLLVGQIACPLPPKSFILEYDLILTSFPHFVNQLKKIGVNSEYFKIGFDERILNKIGQENQSIDFSFVGSITRHHNKANSLIEYLVNNSDLKVYGNGLNNLKRNSVIRKNHNGEKWGLDFYRTIARSKISLNRHINTSENYANNMRLYEATGMGSLLLTDMKDNLNELFTIDKEIVTYTCMEEAAEKVKYFLSNPYKAQKISQAGQKKTLEEHSYKKRMHELKKILERYLQ